MPASLGSPCSFLPPLTRAHPRVSSSKRLLSTPHSQASACKALLSGAQATAAEWVSQNDRLALDSWLSTAGR